MADTAAAAGVKVFVFSTLEDVEKRSKARSALHPAHMKGCCCQEQFSPEQTLVNEFALEPTMRVDTDAVCRASTSSSPSRTRRASRSTSRRSTVAEWSAFSQLSPGFTPTGWRWAAVSSALMF